MRHLLSMLSLFAVLTGLAGCGRTDGTYPVSGMVTFDGEALPEGDILFIPERTDLPREGGKIQNGKFSFQARLGKKRVEVRASRPDPKVKGPNGEPMYVDYLPAAYNTHSTLTAEVTADGPNEFRFPLLSKSTPPDGAGKK